VRFSIAFLLLWLCLATSAFADNRVALVIGNSAYAGVGALANPKEDAALVAATLRGEGFEVTLVQDAKHDAMLKALRSFSHQADQADWALVYYAGHGIEVGGVNYLLPVDVELREDRDAEDEAISLDRVLRAVTSAHKLRLVILNACRNNPFAATMKRSISTRAVGRGLAPAEPEPGTLVVYAAEAGQVAEDGASGHSPFTAALARRLQEPGLEVRRLFDVVTADVLDATDGHQRPYQYGSNPSREAFYFTPPTPTPPSISGGEMAAAVDAATSADQLESLIAFLPEGFLKARAEERLEALKSAPPMPGRRVALVVANSAYRDRPLVNPNVDADPVAASLEKIGFAVTVKRNLDLDAFEGSLVSFADEARGAEIALFYFVGHGFSIPSEGRQQNVLMATDADLDARSGLGWRSGAEPLEHIAEMVTWHARATLIFVDACRQLGFGTRSHGFVPFDVSAFDGAFVVVSTLPGGTVSEGPGGQGSPFARAFAEVLPTPRLRIGDTYARIREGVSKETTGKQVPDLIRSDLPTGGLVLAQDAPTKR
jgi:uncharacterized caspase-like protein